MGRIVTQDLSNLRAGEDDVLHLLAEELPDDWDLACTLEIPDGEDSRELDVVAISPRAVWVVEVKHHRGELNVGYNSLTRGGMPCGRPPYAQVNGAARVLADFLRRRSPEFRAIGGKPVHGHVAFSNRRARLLRVDTEIAHAVSTLENLTDDLVRRDAGSTYDLSTCKERLSNVLSAVPIRDEIPSRILSWTLGERLSTSKSARTFEAVHDDGSEYVLRLLRPSNSLDKEYAQRQREGLLREYETLRTLSARDVCPTVESFIEPDESDFVVVPIQAVEGRTLVQEINDGSDPDGSRVREVVGAAFRALAIVHEMDPGIVHRAITPDRVVIAPNGTVKFTDFQVAHIDEKTGLTAVLTDIDPDEQNTLYWRAPEARQDLAYASSHSDVWSLATTLRAWVIGSVKSGDLKKHTVSGEVRVRLGDVADDFVDLLREARADKPAERPSARTIADTWGPIEEPETTAISEAGVPETVGGPLCHREIEIGEVITGRYELIERLGAGATAVTYLVRDLETEEVVVLKSFDFERVPENLALKEFKHAKSLVHERVATVREFHRPEHPFHLVMDHARGQELSVASDRFRGDAAAVTALAESLLEGLAYIHEKGFLHRDISPRNVIVSEEDPSDLKIIDFGLAALNSDSGPRSMGTFGYVAPEIIRGGEWTPPADVYSAGVVIYQALTGDWPFEFSGAPIHDELKEPPSHLGDEASRLARLVFTAVNPDPSARFPDAGEFLGALHELAESHADSDPEGEHAPEDVTNDDAGARTTSWLDGLSTITDLGDPGQGSAVPATQDPSRDSPTSWREPADEPPPRYEVPASAPSAAGTTITAQALSVRWLPDRPLRPTGNCTLGVGRTRKYSLGLDGTVRGVLAANGRERTLYTTVPDEFVDMVNAAKAAGGQSAGGTFVIDHAGNVLVGTGGGMLLAGVVDGYLSFEEGGSVLTPVPDGALSPGDPWDGLAIGLRYKLNASASDIAYESDLGGWVWLSDDIGEDDAYAVSSLFGRTKRGGGRFYVNEAGAAFGPTQVGGAWREVFLGVIDPARWFSAAS